MGRAAQSPRRLLERSRWREDWFRKEVGQLQRHAVLGIGRQQLYCLETATAPLTDALAVERVRNGLENVPGDARIGKILATDQDTVRQGLPPEP
jgi:hypothetical protein